MIDCDDLFFARSWLVFFAFKVYVLAYYIFNHNTRAYMSLAGVKD